jgi:Ni2+-binding GTPase involved in maturation of urease and hydrogenase
MIKRPNGIVLVTGPTGSGKTTTLHSALSELNDIETKIITTEDPVEYDIDGLLQVPVNPDIEVTAGGGLLCGLFGAAGGALSDMLLAPFAETVNQLVDSLRDDLIGLEICE